MLLVCILTIVLVSNLLVSNFVVISFVPGSKDKKKTIRFGFLGSIFGFFASYLFYSGPLGIRPHLFDYYGMVFKVLSSTDHNEFSPLEWQLFVMQIFSTVFICTLLGLFLGIGVGAIVGSKGVSLPVEEKDPVTNQRLCKACGKQNREHARFCGHCGRPL